MTTEAERPEQTQDAGREAPSYGDFCPPPWVALCPHCKGLMLFRPQGFEQRDGRWFATDGELTCWSEEESEVEHDWSMPYVTLLPLEQRVLRWFNRERP